MFQITFAKYSINNILSIEIETLIYINYWFNTYILHFIHKLFIQNKKK